MDILGVIEQNLLNPVILFFVLGFIAGLVKSDLDLPGNIGRFLSIYLMIAIGFKGGVAIADTPALTPQLLGLIIAGIGLSLAIPFAGFLALKASTKLDVPTAAGVSAHYGSVSVVTFVAATSFLMTNNIPYEGYIIAILALMEAPAILSGLYLARKYGGKVAEQGDTSKLLKKIITNSAVMLLVGSFFIGWITGERGMERLGSFFVTPFQGILALFLLDMGLQVSRNIQHLKSFTWALAAFGIYMPLACALIGIVITTVLQVDLGTGMLFAVLCASASYIAVPAALRLTLPEAQAAIYIPLSLAITFPFNILIGIPLYYSFATYFLTP